MPFLIAALWLLSFFFSLPLIQPYELARLAAIVCGGAGFGLSLYEWLKATPGTTPARSLWILAALFWALCGASVFWSTAPFISVIAFATFSLMPLSFFLLLMTRDGGRIFGIGITGAVVILTLLGASAVVQYFFLPDLHIRGGVRWPFADPNTYAALLNLGFFIALGLLMTTKKESLKFMCLMACAVMICGTIVIGGRLAIILAFLGFISFLFLARRHVGRNNRSLFILALIAGAMMMLVSLPVTETGRVTPLSRLNMLEESAGSRLDIWRSTIDIIAAHPISGTGLGTFHLFYPEARHDTEIYSSGLMAHNDPLQFWAEAGLAAPILLYAFLIICILKMRLFLKSIPPDDPRRMLPVALFCGLGVLIIHAHATFLLTVASVLSLTGFLLGGWILLVARPDQESSIHLVPKIKYPVLAILPLIIFLTIAQAALRSEFAIRQARDHAMAGDMDSFSRAVNTADALSRGMNDRSYLLAAAVPLGLLEGRVGNQDDLAQQAQTLLAGAENANPRNPAINYHRGRLANLTGNNDAAIDHLRAALHTDPLHLPSRVLLSDLLNQEGKGDEAYKTLTDGRAWPHTLHDPRPFYGLIAKEAAMRGDHDIAQDALARLHRLQKRFDAARVKTTSHAPDEAGRGAVIP